VPTSAPAAAPIARPAASPAAAVAQSVAAPAPAPAAQGNQPPTDAAQLPITQATGRMVIYTTEIAILAQDLQLLPDRLGTLALAHGGYVAGVETKADAGVPTVVVRLKVPPDQYEATMSGVRNLAVDVRSEKAATQDVTEEYSDTQAQITSLEATHAQLLELMKRTGSMDELLKVQQQADQVRLQIDRLKGRGTALERLSSLASIGVTAQAAGPVIEQDYAAALTAVRQTETQRAGLQSQLKRARTPEEEAGLRDKIGQADLALQRLRARLSALDQEATRLNVALPRPDETALLSAADESLPTTYVQTRVELRRAQADQKQLTTDLQAGASEATPDRLQAAILRTNDLSVRLKTVQDRAGQAGIVLPTISNDEEAAMAQITTRPTTEGVVALRRAWDASLLVLQGLGSVLVFLWWVLLPLGAAGVFLVRRRVVGGTGRRNTSPLTAPGVDDGG
jgi:hypothetical protein